MNDEIKDYFRPNGYIPVEKVPKSCMLCRYKFDRKCMVSNTWNDATRPGKDGRWEEEIYPGERPKWCPIQSYEDSEIRIAVPRFLESVIRETVEQMRQRGMVITTEDIGAGKTEIRAKVRDGVCRWERVEDGPHWRSECNRDFTQMQAEIHNTCPWCGRDIDFGGEMQIICETDSEDADEKENLI